MTIRNCVAVANLRPHAGVLSPYQPWSQSTQVKFLVVYPLPWSLQPARRTEHPGIPITRATCSERADSCRLLAQLGRAAIATLASTVTLDLIPPSLLHEDRLQQVISVQPALPGGKARVRANFTFIM